jgi:hypothetical protein
MEAVEENEYFTVFKCLKCNELFKEDECIWEEVKMSFFTTKHDEAGGNDFSPLPIGEYEVICSKAEAGKSGAGNPTIKLELTVRDDVEQTGQRRKFFHNLTFTDKTKGIIQGALKAFGVEDGTNFDSPEQMAREAFAYKPVRLKNKHEIYNDKEQDRVAYFMPTLVTGPVGNSDSSDPFAAVPAGGISDEDLPF